MTRTLPNATYANDNASATDALAAALSADIAAAILKSAALTETLACVALRSRDGRVADVLMRIRGMVQTLRSWSTEAPSPDDALKVLDEFLSIKDAAEAMVQDMSRSISTTRQQADPSEQPR